ncbi:hypothetical protein ACIBCT_40015 [Streptosporangium sp. NPDC050855]|uniref:hypothetical protein n=1 Tax=Streptosporangium sp. NPDC050855 TaxID=3366194 RepID=UPI0037993691
MTTLKRSGWARWIWLSLSVVVPVAVAVASNQILTDAGWSWGWSAIAVALAAAGAAVAYRLTRAEPPAPAGEADPSAEPRRTASPGQVVTASTAGGSIDQVRRVGHSVRLRDSAKPALPPSTPTAPAPASPTAAPPLAPSNPPVAGEPARDGADDGPPSGGQRVSNSHASGSITQVEGVDGDVTIERS